MKQRSMRDARGLDQLAALRRLGLALGGQVDVHPAGEAVLQVPLALAMAQQDEGRQGRITPEAEALSGLGVQRAAPSSDVAAASRTCYSGRMLDRLYCRSWPRRGRRRGAGPGLAAGPGRPLARAVRPRRCSARPMQAAMKRETESRPAPSTRPARRCATCRPSRSRPRPNERLTTPSPSAAACWPPRPRRSAPLAGALDAAFAAAVETLFNAEGPGRSDRHRQVGPRGAQDRRHPGLHRHRRPCSSTPAEASHGDLGMIGADDVILALSKIRRGARAGRRAGLRQALRHPADRHDRRGRQRARAAPPTSCC